MIASSLASCMCPANAAAAVLCSADVTRSFWPRLAKALCRNLTAKQIPLQTIAMQDFAAIVRVYKVLQELSLCGCYNVALSAVMQDT